MAITAEEAQEYRMVYKKVYGVEISQEEAIEEGSKLILLLELTVH